MATTGPGLTPASGPFYLETADPTTQGGAGAVWLGLFGQLYVDKRTDPPSVSLNSRAIAGTSSEFYALVATNTAVASNADVQFASDGPSSADLVNIERLSADTFRIATNNGQEAPGLFEISWGLSVLESTAQTAIYVKTGTVSNFAGPGIFAPSVVGRGTASSQLCGRAIVFIDIGVVATFSIRNVCGSSFTLAGNAGGSDPVAATLVVRRL